jgi:hypothetical protein
MVKGEPTADRIGITQPRYFAGIASYSRAWIVICGHEAENVAGRVGGFRRRAYWRGCPRAANQICALLALAEQAGPRLYRCQRDSL